MGNGSMIPYSIPAPPPALRVGSSDSSMDGHGIKKSFQEMRWHGIVGEAEEDLKMNEGMGVQESEANESLHVRSKNSIISLASAHISGDSFHFWPGETVEWWADEGKALPLKKRTTITYQSDEEEEEGKDLDLPPKREKTEEDKAVLPLKKRSTSLTYRYEEDEEEEVKVLPDKKRKRVYSYKCIDQQREEDDEDKALPLKKRSRLHNTVEEKQEQCEDQGIDEEKEHCMINKGDEREEQHDEEEKKEGKEGTDEANYIIEEESEKKEFADEEEIHEEKEHCMVEEDSDEEDMGTHKTDPMYCMINKGDKKEEEHDQEEKKEWKEGTKEANCIIEEESDKKEFVDEEEVNEEKEHYMVEEDKKEDMGTHKIVPIDMSNPSHMTVKKSQDEEQYEEVEDIHKRSYMMEGGDYGEDMGTQITNPITLIAIAASWLTKKEEDDGQMPMVELIGGMKVVTKPRSKGGRKPRTVYTPLITIDSVAAHFAAIAAVLERKGGEEEDLYSKVKRRQGRVVRGSRCTRVNGKGWRCIKLTRVGYSLCDHHLGRQARLRTMSGLRRRVVWESEKRLKKERVVAPKHGAVRRRGRKKRRSFDP